jgi:hypothetical protein
MELLKISQQGKIASGRVKCVCNWCSSPTAREGKRQINAALTKQSTAALKTARFVFESYLFRIPTGTLLIMRDDFIFLSRSMQKALRESRGNHDCFFPNPFHSRESSYKTRVTQIPGAISTKRLNFEYQCLIFVVKSVAVCGSETWHMTHLGIKILNAKEVKIVRRMNGPMVEQGTWRIRINQELRIRHLSRQ